MSAILNAQSSGDSQAQVSVSNSGTKNGEKTMTYAELSSAAEAAISAGNLEEAKNLLVKARKVASDEEKPVCAELLKEVRKELKAKKSQTSAAVSSDAAEEVEDEVDHYVPTPDDVRMVFALNRMSFFIRFPRIREATEHKAEANKLHGLFSKMGINWNTSHEKVTELQKKLFAQLKSSAKGRRVILEVIDGLLLNDQIPPEQSKFATHLVDMTKKEKRRSALVRRDKAGLLKLKKQVTSEISRGEIGENLTPQEEELLSQLRIAKELSRVQELLEQLPQFGDESYQRFVTSMVSGCSTLKSYRESPDGVTMEMIYHLHQYGEEALDGDAVAAIEALFSGVSDDTLIVIRDDLRVYGARALLLARRRAKKKSSKGGQEGQTNDGESGSAASSTESDA